jgi:hypothetical protein
MPEFNIRYEIVGRVDGRWSIEAFNRQDKKIGLTILVNTVTDAFRIFLLLNGYSYNQPVPELDDKTEVINEVLKAS